MTRLAIRTFSTVVLAAWSAFFGVTAFAADAPAAAPAPAPNAGSSAAAQQAPVVPVAKGPLQKNPIELQIKLIRAQRSGQFIDRRVRSIEKLLKPLFNFASYGLMREEKRTLAFDTETTIKLAINVSARITQKGMRDKKIRLLLRVGKQTVKLLLEDGGTFLHGVTLKNGQNYILAITASSK